MSTYTIRYTAVAVATVTIEAESDEEASDFVASMPAEGYFPGGVAVKFEDWTYEDVEQVES